MLFGKHKVALGVLGCSSAILLGPGLNGLYGLAIQSTAG